MISNRSLARDCEEPALDRRIGWHRAEGLIMVLGLFTKKLLSESTQPKPLQRGAWKW